MPQSAEERQLEEETRRVLQAIEEQRTRGGDAKPLTPQNPPPAGQQSGQASGQQPNQQAGQPSGQQSGQASGQQPNQQAGQPSGQAEQKLPTAGAAKPQSPLGDGAAAATPPSEPKPAPSPDANPGSSRPMGTPAANTPPPNNTGMPPPSSSTAQQPRAVPPGEDRPSPAAARPREDKANAAGSHVAGSDAAEPTAAAKKDGPPAGMAGAQPAGGAAASSDPKGAQNASPQTDGGRNAAAQLTPEQRRELEQAVRDLASGDPARQQAARQKLDQTLGQANRQAIEQELARRQAERDQLLKDLQSPDPQTRAAAQKLLQQLQQEAADASSKNPAGQPPALDPAERKTLAEAARDLLSPDPAKRRQAEQTLDKRLGRQQREQLQQQLDKLAREMAADGKSSDPQRQQQFERQLQQELDNRLTERQQSGRGLTRGPIDLDKYLPSGGAPAEPPLPEMEADPRHRARTAELQLEQFERHRNDPELLQRLGWTQEDYDRFLEAQRRRLIQLQQQALSAEDLPRPLRPQGPLPPPGIQVGGASKVEGRGTTDRPTVIGGAPLPPPGFEQAGERFFEELRRRQKK